MERVVEEGQWTLFGFLTRSFFMKVPKAIIIIVITGAFGMKIWLSRTIRYHRCVATNGSLSELTYFLLLLLEFSFLFIFLMAIVLTTMRRDRGKNTKRVFVMGFFFQICTFSDGRVGKCSSSARPLQTYFREIMEKKGWHEASPFQEQVSNNWICLGQNFREEIHFMGW